MKTTQTIGVKETARRFGCTLKYVYDLLYAGRLPGRKVGKTWSIPVDSNRRAHQNEKMSAAGK
jgi:excisionase family DNA binding protein